MLLTYQTLSYAQLARLPDKPNYVVFFKVYMKAEMLLCTRDKASTVLTSALGLKRYVYKVLCDLKHIHTTPQKCDDKYQMEVGLLPHCTNETRLRSLEICLAGIKKKTKTHQKKCTKPLEQVVVPALIFDVLLQGKNETYIL